MPKINLPTQKVSELAEGARERLTDAAIKINDAGIAVMDKAGDAAEYVNTKKEELAERGAQMRFDRDVRTLKPVFQQDFTNADFNCPSMLNVVVRDRRRRDSLACKDSIGFTSVENGLTVLNVFDDSLNKLDFNFYPDANKKVYYINPCDSNFFIELDEYFDYLKKVRVDELQKIAQDLGARHVSIALKETTKAKIANKLNAKVGAKDSTRKKKGAEKIKKEASVEVDHNSESSKNVSIAVEAESFFEGKKEPAEPVLTYFKNDYGIKNLIAMRMDKSNNLNSKKYSIKCSDSSGMKVRDAAKIAGALSKMKVSAGATLTNDANRESNLMFEYLIEF